MSERASRPAVGWWRRLWSWFLTLRAAGYRHFGDLYADRESFEKAVFDLTRAIELDAGNAGALLMRGTIYWRELNIPERAVQDLTRVLQLIPGHAEALFQRGCARINAGDAAGARQDLEEYLRRFPAGGWSEHARRLREMLDEVPLQEDGAGRTE
jgi:regulator of sirC expression with transglutaminase-like and TPR domain